MRVLLVLTLITLSVAAVPTSAADPATLSIPSLVPSLDDAPSHAAKTAHHAAALVPWIAELPTTPPGKIRLAEPLALPVT